MKVLIVDDSKTMRMIVRRTLRQAGFEAVDVAEAESGNEALTLLSKEKVDLILSDWNMPGMSGLDLLVALRGAKNATRFGFITSQSTPEMHERARQSGALFLIAKPFTPETFQEVLRPLLR
jgi:two-component system chemotaxis response regulator CheY